MRDEAKVQTIPRKTRHDLKLRPFTRAHHAQVSRQGRILQAQAEAATTTAAAAPGTTARANELSEALMTDALPITFFFERGRQVSPHAIRDARYMASVKVTSGAG